MAPTEWSTTVNTTELQITRTELPLIDIPTDTTMWGEHDTYAEVTAGSIKAEVLRFVYWDDRDGTPPETLFEVRINGMPEDGGGASELYATEPSHLLDLAAVCGAAAMLLNEARQTHRIEAVA
jgi:hypothetical protein